MIAVAVALAVALAPLPGAADEPVDAAAPSPEVVPTDDASTPDAAPDGPPDPAPATPQAGAPPERTVAPRVVEPHPGVVGGYWDMDRTRGREPDDGREEIIVGSILVPIGIIAVSSAAATVWLSAPGHCQERWASVGAAPTADQCKGVRVFGIIRVSYGSLMVVTGSVLLGIGMHRRERHRKWERGGVAIQGRLTPWFGGGSGGLTYTARFGGQRW